MKPDEWEKTTEHPGNVVVQSAVEFITGLREVVNDIPRVITAATGASDAAGQLAYLVDELMEKYEKSLGGDDDEKDIEPVSTTFYNSPAWARVRITVLKRDNYTCQLCGAKPACVVHHLNSPKFHPDLASDVNNLIVVCRKCHEQYHDKS